jgi:hypothetical protein
VKTGHNHERAGAKEGVYLYYPDFVRVCVG